MILAPPAADPGVAVGVIEMPVGIDEMGHGLWGEGGERLRHLGARHADACIDHDEAVLAAKYRDVAAGAFEDGDVIPQLVGGDLGLGGTVLDEAHQTARLGIGLAWAHPPPCGGETRRADAAKAKSTAGEHVFGLHDIPFRSRSQASRQLSI